MFLDLNNLIYPIDHRFKSFKKTIMVLLSADLYESVECFDCLSM